MQLVGDAVNCRHLRLTSLPLAVLAGQPPCDEEWLCRLAAAEDGAAYGKVAQLFAAVYAHSQTFAHVYYGQVSASTQAGIYR